MTKFLYSVVLVLLLSLPTVACAQQTAPAKMLDIQTVTSKSGITAWLVEDHSIPVIALKFAFKNAGTKHDPADKQGLARMVSNTLDEGAGDLNSQAFQKELQNLAITLNFSAGRDNFGGQVKTLTKHKDRAFELLTMALTMPRFDEEPVSRMRAANQSRIRSSMTNPDWMAARLLNDKAFAGHPYAQNSGGTLSTLENITIEDLRAFPKQFGRDNLIVGVTGDLTADELKTVLDDVFGGLPQTAPVQRSTADIDLQNQGKVFVYKKDIPQTIIEIVQPGIGRTDPDYHTAQVMNFILGGSGFGSRLMEEIREKRGLTYGVYSSLQDLDHIDTLSVSTSTKNELVPEMMGLIKAEWDKMTEAPVTVEELNAAQQYLIGSVPLSFTSTDNIAGFLLSLQSDELPTDYLEQRQTAIENVTPEDIQTLAQKLLDQNKFLTVLVGQPEMQTDSSNHVVILDALPNVE